MNLRPLKVYYYKHKNKRKPDQQPTRKLQTTGSTRCVWEQWRLLGHSLLTHWEQEAPSLISRRMNWFLTPQFVFYNKFIPNTLVRLEQPNATDSVYTDPQISPAVCSVHLWALAWGAPCWETGCITTRLNGMSSFWNKTDEHFPSLWTRRPLLLHRIPAVPIIMSKSQHLNRILTHNWINMTNTAHKSL